MTDDSTAYHVVQKPRMRADDVTIADFTMMVRVPGRPAALRVFTDAEIDEANGYAAENGGVVVSLPLAPPSSYVVDDTSGLLIPAPDPEH
ncbi:hypothetical protein [Mycolicibacterium mageritense]|uniref:hypothetical protein n=1 Tax=Mycolicibacterium mageritense TaxID=53462 RepID=UPI0011D64E6D|nr:hypothetical protein [Mycolicibacterium mageritense]TXI63399.1 MAG: hypothetical protein E6Q55_09560 [Mycolicibacterium mageritense]